MQHKQNYPVHIVLRKKTLKCLVMDNRYHATVVLWDKEEICRLFKKHGILPNAGAQRQKHSQETNIILYQTV